MYIGIMLYVGIISLFFHKANFSFRGSPLDKKAKSKLYLFLIFSVLILVAGFRNNTVGIDTIPYQNSFEIIKETHFSDIFKSYYPVNTIGGELEIGFVLLAKICSFFSDSYYFFQMIMVLITGFFSAKFIHDNSDDVMMSTILYLGLGMYLSSFNVARQWMAAAIACNGWSMLRKSKVKGILLLVWGVSIHFATILVAVSALIYVFKNSKFWIRFIPVAITLVALRYQIVLDIIAPYLPSKYDIYMYNMSDPQTQVLNFVTYAIVFVLLILFVTIRSKTNSQHKFYAILGAIYIVCEIIGMSFNKFERIGLAFTYFVLLLFPAATKYIKNKWLRRAYYSFIIVFYSFLFVHRAINTEEFIYSSYLFD